MMTDGVDRTLGQVDNGAADDLENHKRLKRHNALLRKALAASRVLGEAVSSELEMERLCDVVVEQFVEIFVPHTLVLLFHDDDSGELYVKRRAGPGVAPDGERLAPGQGVAGAAMAKQRLVFLEEGDPRLRQASQVNLFRDPRSLIAVPLTAGGASRRPPSAGVATAALPLMAERRVKGVLALSWQGPEHTPQREDLHALEALGAQAAAAIDNAWLYGQLHQLNADLERKVQERTQELRQSNEQLDHTLQALKQAQSQMVQTEKMASLGQLTAGIAHEINNPLAFVINNVALVRERLTSMDRQLRLHQACERAVEQTTDEGRRDALLAYVRSLQAEPEYAHDVSAFFNEIRGLDNVSAEHQLAIEFLRYVRAREQQTEAGGGAPASRTIRLLLDRALDGLGRVKEIVLDLRSFARLDEADFQNVKLDTGIASTLSIVEHLAQDRQVELLHRPGCETPYPCFPAKLNQVVLNLVTNALQATSAGGRVTVTTRDGPSGPSIDVEDTGAGIPEETLKKIFDPFFTTKPVGQGTGLGLSISYKIIEEHGGRIDVESRVGEGTRFRVQLPPRKNSVED